MIEGNRLYNPGSAGVQDTCNIGLWVSLLTSASVEFKPMFFQRPFVSRSNPGWITWCIDQIPAELRRQGSTWSGTRKEKKKPPTQSLLSFLQLLTERMMRIQLMIAAGKERERSLRSQRQRRERSPRARKDQRRKERNLLPLNLLQTAPPPLLRIVRLRQKWDWGCASMDNDYEWK